MKKILFLFSILGMVILSGCSTGSLELQKPIYSGKSAKNPDEVNRCLAPKWVELRPSSNSIPTEYGYKLIASDDIFGALAIAIITQSKDGSSDIKVFAVSKGVNDPWGNAARSCL